jgi:hypothetical protein
MRYCTVCGDLRPVSDMKVFKKDVSTKYGAEMGTFVVDVWYCKDKDECKNHAPEVEV